VGIYNAFAYGDGVLYGDVPRLEFSAYPFRATAITYSTTSLRWTIPEGDYVNLRVVRSLDGYPETQEDGEIVYEWESTTGAVKLAAIIDGEFPTTAIESGRFVYYRVWVLKRIGLTWKMAGDAITLVPKRHDSTLPSGEVLVPIRNKVLDLLPRVFTSESQSPIDEVDDGSDLAQFLDGFTFMLDSLLTYADLLLPEDSARYISPDIIFLQTLQLGLIPEAYIATKQQRRLIREALYFYQRKGTFTGIGSFIESFTGYAPDVRQSPNLMLTPQDSSLTNGVGFWKAIGNCTVESINTVPTPTETTEPFAVDYQYVGKVTVNEIGARLSTGLDDPVRYGTPVQAGVPYTCSGYAQAATAGMSVIGFVSWFDQNGNIIRSDPPLTFAQAPTPIGEGLWTRFQFSGRAPGAILPMIGYSITSNVATITLGTFNTLLPGEVILVEGISDEFDGQYIIQNVGINTLQLETPLADVAESAVIGQVSEAVPKLVGPLGTTDLTDIFPIAGNVAFSPSGPGGGFGVMEIDFNPAVFNSFNPLSNFLSPGDYLLIQGVTAAADFGTHRVLSVSDSSATMTYYDFYGQYTDDPGLEVGISGGAKKLDVDREDPATLFTPAVYAGFETVFLNTGVVYVDMLQVASLEVDKYHEARAVEVFLNPSKTNYLNNPCFDPEGLDEWEITAFNWLSVEESDLGVIGNGNVLQIDTTALGLTSLATTTGRIPTGKFFSASIYGKTETEGQTEALSWNVSIIDVTNFPTTEVVASTTVPAVFTDTWQRYAARVFVDPIDDLRVLVARVTLAGVTQGNTIYVDKAQLETSFVPTDYFDGDLPASYGAVWEGVPHRSPSHLYPNLAQRTTRLQQELKNYLVTNQPYLIQWHGGGIKKSSLY
jgi:hypothetical protein